MSHWLKGHVSQSMETSAFQTETAPHHAMVFPASARTRTVLATGVFTLASAIQGKSNARLIQTAQKAPALALTCNAQHRIPVSLSGSASQSQQLTRHGGIRFG